LQSAQSSYICVWEKLNQTNTILLSRPIAVLHEDLQ